MRTMTVIVDGKEEQRECYIGRSIDLSSHKLEMPRACPVLRDDEIAAETVGGPTYILRTGRKI